MAITFQCGCGKSYTVDDKHAGKQTTCRACGSALIVPAAGSAGMDSVITLSPAQSSLAVPAERPVRPAPARPAPAVIEPAPLLEAIVLLPLEPVAAGPVSRSSAAIPLRPAAPVSPVSSMDDSFLPDTFPAPSQAWRPKVALPAKTSGLAITSLVLGLLALVTFFVGWLFAIPAIITGVLSLRAIGGSQGRVSGKPFAIAGISLGGLSIPISIMFVVFAIQGARTVALRVSSEARMRSIALAIHTYQDANHRWPRRLEDLKPYLEGEAGYKKVTSNPITGDEPGYAYVLPDDPGSPNGDRVIVLWQLRRGTVDTTLPAMYLNMIARVPSGGDIFDAQRRADLMRHPAPEPANTATVRTTKPNNSAPPRTARPASPPRQNPGTARPAPPPVRVEPASPPVVVKTPAPPPLPPVVAKLQLVGGFDGNPFGRGGGPGTRFAGIVCNVNANYAGQSVIQDIEPYFTGYEEGPNKAFPKPGYTVGGFVIDADKYVNAIQVVFVRRQENGKLDPKDRYNSPWIGTPTGRPTVEIPQHGEPVCGLYGLKGDVISALSVMVELPTGSSIPVLEERKRPAEQGPITSAALALGAFKDPDVRRQREAAQWLNNALDAEIAPADAARITAVLWPLLATTDHGAKEDFLQAFSRYAGPKDIGHLEELAAPDKEHSGSWGIAVATLMRLDPARARRILENQYSNFFYRTAVSQALKKLDSRYEPAVIQLLGSSNAGVRSDAVDILSEMGTKRCLSSLQKVMTLGSHSEQFHMKHKVERAVAAIRQRGN